MTNLKKARKRAEKYAIRELSRGRDYTTTIDKRSICVSDYLVGYRSALPKIRKLEKQVKEL